MSEHQFDPYTRPRRAARSERVDQVESRGNALDGLLFGVIALVLAGAAEVLLIVALDALFRANLVPRGLGWLVFPFVAASSGWALGARVGTRAILRRVFGSASTRDALNSTQTRLWLVGCGVWIVLILGIFFFQPFGRYWQLDAWIKFWTVLAGPPLLAAVAALGYRWATASRDQASK